MYPSIQNNKILIKLKNIFQKSKEFIESGTVKPGKA
jgi:hypothetical protein